ncbi:MAG: hypothetical protein HY706_20050 [Candidatus Hydrogenedentes bacterium]|nr:hypothetical protein [Candidatus Hydrogenedentota bacterium]
MATTLARSGHVRRVVIFPPVMKNAFSIQNRLYHVSPNKNGFLFRHAAIVDN